MLSASRFSFTTFCVFSIQNIIFKMGKVLFSVQEDVKLVEIVAKYPCLYDVTSFKDQNDKDSALKEVAKHVQRSEDHCKKRWRNIKDTYKKRMKRGKSNSNKGKQWMLAPMLSFLDSVIQRQQSASNYQHDLYASSSDEEMPICETLMAEEDIKPVFLENIANIPSTKKIKLEEPFLETPSCQHEKHLDEILERLEARLVETEEVFENLTRSREDDVDLFFKSIAMSVKKLKPELIHEAKLRSLQMLTELENRT